MLRKAGVSRIVMVTGDRADAAETIGAALDLDAVLAEREPADKVDAVATEQRQSPTVMVGDGINDAPALAAADVGIAMGARGASASSEAADVVILVDRLDRVADAVVILNALRALVPARTFGHTAMPSATATALRQEHEHLDVALDRLREIADGLDDAQPAGAATLIAEANDII